VFYRAPSPGNPPPAATQQPAAPTTTSVPETVPPATPPETAPPAQTPVAKIKTPAPNNPPKVEKVGKEAEAKPQPKPQGETSVDGFSANDIPSLLQMAQSAYESGDSVKAEYDYKTILRLQPNNPDALQGLHKLDLSRKEKNR
jgi:hypothetical protein